MRVGLSLDDQLSGALNAAAQNVTVFTGSVERSLMALGRLGPAAAGLAAVGAAMKVGVSAAGDLQQQMANLNAVLDATPRQMDKIIQSSLELSRQSQFTAAQIIQAQTQLAKAGNSPGDVVAQTRDVLNLASATFSAPQQAANAYVAAMKTFQISNSDSTATVDTLAKAVDSSVGTLADFQTAFKQIGPVANSAHMSLRDTSVAVTDLMNAGLRGDTGTALKTFIQRIEHETPQARAEVQKLGLSFYDAQGQMLSMGEIADQLRTKMAGLTDEQKNFSLTQIFGARGVRVADIFSSEGSSGLSDVTDHMNELGDASEIARKKLDTFQGQAHILASSLNILAVQTGQGLLPMLTALERSATGVANAFSTMNQHVPVAPQEALGSLAVLGEVALMSRLGDARNKPARTQYESDLAAYNAQVASASTKDINLQQGTRNTAIEEQAYASSVGSVNLAEQRRISLMEQELVLLRTKGQLEAEVFAQEEKAAAAGMARHTAKMTALAEEQAIAERQSQQRVITQTPDPSVASSIARSKASQAFLAQGGDLVGLEAYQRDLTTYEEKVAQIKAQAAAAGLQNVKVTIPAPALADYAPQAAVKRTIADVERDLSANPPVVTAPIKPNFIVAEEEKAAAKGRVSKMISGIGAGFGEIAMPILIALTVKQLIGDPVNAALSQWIAEQKVGKTFDIKDFLGLPADNQVALQEYIKQQQDMLDRIQNANHNGGERALDKLFGGQLYSSDSDAETARLKENIAAASKEMKDFTNVIESAPAKARGALSELEANISAAVMHGEMTTRDGMQAFDDYIAKYSAFQNILSGGKGLSPEIQLTIDRAKKDLTDTLAADDKQKAAQAQADAAAASTAVDNLMDRVTNARQALGQGATQEMVAGGIFGLLPNGEAPAKGDVAGKQWIKDQQQDIKDLATAWTKARSEIDKVDIAKGLKGLAGDAEGLKKVTDELTRLGTGNSHLTALTDMAGAFKDVQDQIAKASQAYDGFMLTITSSNDQIAQLDAISKGLAGAIDAAYGRKNQGIASQSDLDLIARGGDALKDIDKTKSHIQQSTTKDWLGIAENLPDYERANQLVRDTVDRLGGGKAIVAKVTAETDAAKAAIDTLVKGPYNATINLNLAMMGQQLAGVPSWLLSILGGQANIGATGGNAPLPPMTPPNGVSTGVAGGTWNQYHPLDEPSYGQIVGGFANAQPYQNHQMYASIIAAAQEAGVDPRLLLALVKNENVDPDLMAANNFTGLKYGGQALAHPGPSAPADEGPTPYAGFDSPQDFWYTVAKGLTTGPYAGAYQGGDLYQERRTFVTGGAQGSPQQEANINGTVGDYADYATRFPWTDPNKTFPGAYGGGGAVSNPGDDAATSVRQQIVNKALGSVGIDAFVNECEKWVEQTLESITGKRGATGQNEGSATIGFRDAAAMGLETHNPQKGDLVYYPSASGGDGHVAIYMGNGQQVSTYDQGNPIGDNRKIHTEAVGAGARYISVPGLPDDFSGSPTGIDGRLIGAGTAGSVGTRNGTAPGIKTAEDGAKNLAGYLNGANLEIDTLRQKFAQLGSKEIAQVVAEAAKIQPMLNQQALAALPAGAGPEQQKAALAVAGREGLQLEALYAQGMYDITNHTGKWVDDVKQIAALGGPIGQYLAQEVATYAAIDAATEKEKADKKALTDYERDYAALQKQRQEADRNEAIANQYQQWALYEQDTQRSRNQTLDQWKNEDARSKEQEQQRESQRMVEDARLGEDANWNVRQRQFQDQQRYLDFYGSEKKKQLSDEMLQLTEQERVTLSMNRVQQNLLQSRVANATNGGDRRMGMEQLAIATDFNKTQERRFADEKSAQQRAIDAEDRLASKQRFDLETQILTETRAHEDRLKTIDDTERASSRYWQAVADFEQRDDRNRQRALTVEGWNIEDNRKRDEVSAAMKKFNTEAQRQLEDEAHATNVAHLQDVVTKDGDVLKGFQDDLAALQAIGTEAQKIFGQYGGAANLLLGGNGGKTPVTGTPPPDPAKQAAATAALPSNVTPFPTQPAAVVHANLNLGDLGGILSSTSQARIKKVVQTEVAAAMAGQTTTNASAGRVRQLGG